MAVLKNKSTEYAVRYSDFDGVDLSGDGSAIDPKKLSYSENMYKPRGGGALESFPGYRQLYAFAQRINGIHSQKLGDGNEYLLVHTGSSLYRFNKSERDSLKSLTPILSDMADKRSHSFTKGGSLFISDTERIIRIKPDGTVNTVDGEHAYIPITFKNGKPFEQRNLIGTKFRELYDFGNAEMLYRRSDNLVFEVSDDGKSCILSATRASISGEVYVPAYAKIGEEFYRVRAIADYAFAERRAISIVHIADGVYTVGRYAFKDCTGLMSVELSASTREILEGAFSGCTELFKAYLGKCPESFGQDAFKDVKLSELTVSFGTDEQKALKISGYSQLGTAMVNFLAENPKECFAIPIMTPLATVESVYISGDVLSAYSVSNRFQGEIPRYLYFLGRRSSAEGCTVEITGRCATGEFTNYAEGIDFISRSENDVNVIAGCTVSASFDGRIFLAGNPKYPNTVFFSIDGKYAKDDELFFGTLSYFDDGVATYPTVAIVPVKDTFAVFKSGDDGGGAIYCHEVKKEASILERSYPVLNIHMGFGGCYAAASMLDEAVFVGDSGVFTIERASLGAAKVTKRSTSLGTLIEAGVKLEKPDICSWYGYSVLRLGDRLFLGEPSSGSVPRDDYAWYPLTNIGAWSDDEDLCRYSPVARNGYLVHPDAEAIAPRPTYSSLDENGEKVYFVPLAAGKRYEVYPTGQRVGGEFHPITVMHPSDSAFFFGTDGGQLMCFNTDLTGVAPERVRKRSDFSYDEYTRDFGEEIHRDFYSFAGHAPRYAISTKSDSCGLPHTAKTTSRGSLTVKLGDGTHEVGVRVRTDGGDFGELYGLSSRRVDFSDLDFSVFSFETSDAITLGVKDNSRGWCEKEITVFTESFASPLRIQSVGYRYRRSGKIKRH